ncbi:hypothetical protein WA026_002387 [Henosepilachna vigintioctopunctata]|uniref:Uncharacterized protein n=1 Tax=Henosepilachna vigintioctopunctata TaxID=420089 RepID=A0AAW1U3R8_9CUCU
MELEEVLKIQNKLIEDRKIYPVVINKIYKEARAVHKKFLMNVAFEISKESNIEEQINIINKYERIGEQDLDELLEQIRIMIILAQKKNCQISKIIDAI